MSYPSYPRWVYSPCENVTRENMRQYDRTREIFRKKCEEVCPDYYKLNLRERMKVKDQVEEMLGYRR